MQVGSGSSPEIMSYKISEDSCSVIYALCNSMTIERLKVGIKRNHLGSIANLWIDRHRGSIVVFRLVISIMLYYKV
jgi:hypothetical protein